MKRALVIGCRGQDGSYLMELLESKDYEVVGLDSKGCVQKATGSGCTIAEPGAVDLCNEEQVRKLISEAQPGEIYFLAAFHHSSERAASEPHELMERSMAVNALALNHVLGAVVTFSPGSRVFYAASSRLFGNAVAPLQDELTPYNPICAYGISKAAGAWLCRYYREELKVHCSVGILYNHESPRRGSNFVSQKIARAAVAIKRGSQARLTVGNLDAEVDWGYAPDYVEAMWNILQAECAGDYVIASGALHSVRDFVSTAFGAVGLDWREYVDVDQTILPTRGRPQATLCGDSKKLRSLTGWQPRISFEQMVNSMVSAEMVRA